MQPPAEVEPAITRMTEQSLSASIMLYISAARPVSREVKLIFFIASTIGRASNDRMSICSTGVESSSALRVSLILVSVFIASLQPLGVGGSRERLLATPGEGIT